MKQWRILVIEDNPGDILLLEEAFASAGLNCEVNTLTDGESALNYARSTEAEYPLPDLITLDLNLPRVDGAGVLAALSGNARFANVPVVVMTSSSSPRDLLSVAAYGVSLFIVKPVDLKTFLKIGATVRELLEGSRQGSLDSTRCQLG